MREKQKYNKEYTTWVKLMEIGARTGCHQMPERSFFVHGYQFPVCARCCGVFTGYLLAPFIYIKLGFQRIKYAAWFGLLAMFFDWWLQAIHIKNSTNGRRLLTGIVGGFGSMVVFIKLIGCASKWIRCAVSKSK